MEPILLERSEHPVSRKHISENALRVLYRLNELRFMAVTILYFIHKALDNFLHGLTFFAVFHNFSIIR